jgi:hypothetical protein
MPDVVMKKLHAGELPESLREGLDVAPDEIVEVTVDARRPRDIEELLRLAHEASEEARRNGLTEEKLAELLADE